MDLAIRGATVVTMRDGRPNVIDDGAVGIRDGELAYVGPDEDFAAAPAETVDGGTMAVLPGLVDAHVHTGLTLVRGGAQDVPEIEWMNRALGPLARHVDDDDRAAGARLGVLEAVRSGVTTLGEYDDHVAELVDRVYEPWGVRVAATETINAVASVPDERSEREPYPMARDKGWAALDRADALADEYADHPLVEPQYGPQAVDMVPPDLLEAAFDRAAAKDRRVHMHVAQGRRERLQVRARYGTDASSVGVLDERGLLGERLLAVHCHGASAADRRRLAESGANYVGCPSSIAAIDGAVPPVEAFREAGADVGLGTDQAPGPGGHDFLREVRTAALLAKTDRGDATALPAWHALRLATLGGARALGVDDRVGSLVAGKRADLLLVDLNDPGVSPTVADPLATVVPNLVYSAGPAAVSGVLVDGEWLLRDGEFCPGDAAAVVAEANERASDVFAKAADDWRAAGSELVDRVADGWL